MPPRRAAIAFDIDGVFKYGRQWSDAGLNALRRASEAKIPYVFVTNGGGGLTEATYGQHLKEKVVAAGGGSSNDIELPSAERMVLSYTPWESLLAPELADKRVLLVGDPAEKTKEVAASYGLKHVTHYSDYARTHPSVNPFRAAQQAGTSHTAVANSTAHTAMSVGVGKAGGQPPSSDEAAEVPFAAILVMCDPYEWYEALQISIDVLCSPTPLSLELDTTAPPMPLHFSNPDFLSKFEHPFPRFAQGAFKVALLALYKARLRALRVPEEAISERCGSSLRQWGKPTGETYRFVEERLRQLAPTNEGASPVAPGTEWCFYMVGDNPTSDMEGVRRANIHHAGQGGSKTCWRGVLVRTGVYKEGDEINGADVVVDGIEQAVDWILEQERGADADDAGAAPAEEPKAKKAKKA